MRDVASIRAAAAAGLDASKARRTFRAVAPELAKVAVERAGKVVVAKVDTEALQQVAARFAIRSIPTMILFEHGKEAKRVSGAMPASAILQQLAI